MTLRTGLTSLCSHRCKGVPTTTKLGLWPVPSSTLRLQSSSSTASRHDYCSCCCVIDCAVKLPVLFESLLCPMQAFSGCWRTFWAILAPFYKPSGKWACKFLKCMGAFSVLALMPFGQYRTVSNSERWCASPCRSLLTQELWEPG